MIPTVVFAAFLMPAPAHVEMGTGKLPVQQTFAVSVSGVRDPRIIAAVKRLLPRLEKLTGMPFTPAKDAPAVLLIHCEHAGAPVQKLGEDESYRLEVTATQARLTAPNPLGV